MSRGQATLSLVFLIGGIVVLVGVTLSFIVVSFLSSSAGFQTANRTLAVAHAGAHDALLRLVRDKNFSAASPYTVPMGTNSASVTVTQNSPTSGKVTILSDAKIGSHERKVRAIVSLEATTGQVSLLSWEHLTF